MGPSPGRVASRLDLVVGSVLRATALDPDDNLSRIAVGPAIDELLDLDPERPGSWRLRGLADGYGLCAESRRAPNVVLERARIGGLLDAAAERGDVERVRTEAAANPSLVGDLVAADDLRQTAGVLVALLGDQPAWAIELAGAAPRAFALWDAFAEAAVARVDGTLGDLSDKERRALSRSLARTLRRWASAEHAAPPALRHALDRTIATIPS